MTAVRSVMGLAPSRLSRTAITLIEKGADAGQTGNCPGPEVLFGEIAIDLLQPRLWTIPV
jgi:hypothetical protein